MKKRVIIVISAVIGVFIRAAVYRTTDKKQEKARKTSTHIPYGIYEAAIKRPLDLILAILAFILLSPVMAIVALMVRVKLGSPLLFRQPRPGLNGKIFTIFKYRTMTDQRGEDGELLPDEKRLTSFGKMLRSTSLDELPELINIIKGDMAIVGPRPLLVEYLPRYDERQKTRHDVRPGLTGLAQISGRNNLSWNEKLEEDVKYIEKITFFMDFRIILKTIAVVFCRTGINSKTSATMELFMGNHE